MALEFEALSVRIIEAAIDVHRLRIQASHCFLKLFLLSRLHHDE